MRESSVEEPILDVACLAHVELLSPKPEETTWFFKDLLGMQETERRDGSVYLRAYEEFGHHSLKITQAERPGLGHVAWRSWSPQALERRAAALEATGVLDEWRSGDAGHGPACVFHTAGGHEMELLWHVERAQIPDERRSLLQNRAQKRPLHGVPVRRLDHLSLLTRDVPAVEQLMTEQLGFRPHARMVSAGGEEVGCYLSIGPFVHDLGVIKDPADGDDDLHHVCYWYGTSEHLLDATEVLREAGIPIEVGPSKHGISYGLFVFVTEPGGNRIELVGGAKYRVPEPDWETVVVDEHDLDSSVVFFGEPVPADVLPAR
jgi:catechol 2,3-dioxygenase